MLRTNGKSSEEREFIGTGNALLVILFISLLCWQQADAKSDNVGGESKTDMLNEKLNSTICALDRQIKEHPKKVSALLRRARANLKLGKVKVALEDLNQAELIDPNNEEIKLYLIGAHLQLGDNQQVVQTCSQLLSNNPRMLFALYERANAFYLLNDCQSALADYDKFLEFASPKKLEEGGASFYKQRSSVYLCLNRLDDALGDLNRAIEIAPDLMLLRSSRARLNERLKHYPEAITDWKYLLSHNPDYFADEFLNSHLRDEVDLSAFNSGYNKSFPSHKIYTENLMKESDLVAVKTFLAETDLLLESYFAKKISQNPGDKTARYRHALICEDLNQMPSAVGDYSQILAINSNEKLALLRRGDAYEKLRDYDKAIEDAEKLIKLDPSNMDAHFLRATCFQLLHEYSKSITEFNVLKNLASQSSAINSASTYQKEADRAIDEMSAELNLKSIEHALEKMYK